MRGRKKHRKIQNDQMQKAPAGFGRGNCLFARHGRALTGESPKHAQIVGSV